MNLQLFFLILPLLLSTLSYSFTIQQLVQMQYINQINSWVPQYLLSSKFNTKNNQKQNHLHISMEAVYQQILPAQLGYNKTKLFAYGGYSKNPLTGENLGKVVSFPGPTIKNQGGKPIFINYTNNIKGPHLFNFPSNLIFDPLMTTQLIINASLVPLVTHVHGAIVQSTSDGYPGAFVTAEGYRGPQYNTIRTTTPNSFVFYYPNYPSQQTLFYHDHMIGMTRINVYAGLAGFYLIQTQNKKTPLSIIDKKYDVLLAIADRTFNDDGSLYYPQVWQPQYFADTITVNGVVWPKLRLANNTYRLRILNACNARFLNLFFVCQGNLIPFTVLKGDQNYLDNSVQVTSILLSPAQRYEILIDFRKYYGKQIQILNDAKTPYPGGQPVIPQTTGRIMRIDIQILQQSSNKVPSLPVSFNRQKLKQIQPIQTRNYILIETMGLDSQVLSIFLGGHDTMAYLKPFIIGQTYQVNFINLTPDMHPMHIHLSNFQTQASYIFDAVQYKDDWILLNGLPPISINKKQIQIDYRTYLLDQASLPLDPLQNGLKDVCLVDTGTVKVVRFRFTQFDGSDYTVDVTKGYGFAFHCHIIEHEDNSMMRLFRLYKQELSAKFIMNQKME